MSYTLPKIEEYEKLFPVAEKVYEQTSALGYQMLLPLFLLSVTMSYATDLSLTASVLLKLKRLILVAVLLVVFPEIAGFCQKFGVEIAKSIDDISGIDSVIQAASKRANEYSFNIKSLLMMRADIIIAGLSLFSYVLLVLARYFILAFQHFYWLLIISLSPFMILAALFENGAAITKGMFKNMIQVACWPILWAVMSAFLNGLSFADTYSNGMDLITVITLNIIIATGLLFSPLLISQICSGVDLSMGSTLNKGLMYTIGLANPKGLVKKVAMKSGGFARGSMINKNNKGR